MEFLVIRFTFLRKNEMKNLKLIRNDCHHFSPDLRTRARGVKKAHTSQNEVIYSEVTLAADEAKIIKKETGPPDHLIPLGFFATRKHRDCKTVILDDQLEEKPEVSCICSH